MDDTFSRLCVDAFRPLIQDFGFAEPEVADLGRECFVRYHKGAATVSVAFEPGALPIVELYFPAGAGDKLAPWADRAGVPYARRIPRLLLGAKYNPENVASLDGYLKESMVQLARVETAFLRSAH